MKYDSNVWDQLKGITAGKLMAALLKSGWTLDDTSGSIHTYKKDDNGTNRRVQVHFHGKNKGWRQGLVKKMLSEIGWSEAELKDLKLIK